MRVWASLLTALCLFDANLAKSHSTLSTSTRSSSIARKTTKTSTSKSSSLHGSTASTKRTSTHSNSKKNPTSGCVVTAVTTVTSTLTPTVTLTTYVNVVDLVNGDDFGTLTYTPSIVQIPNSYTTFISSTLTITSTSIPASLLGVVATTTEPVPSGFVPVQSSLPSGVYLDDLFGPDPVDEGSKIKVRRLHSLSISASRTIGKSIVSTICITTTTTSTVISTADTRVSFITNSSPVTGYAFPQEGYTLYEDVTVPYTVTEVLGNPTTMYAATQTVTTALTQPTSTTTFYAACATNNFADYVHSPDGSLQPIGYATTTRATDVDFDISTDNLNTAYDCCTYAIKSSASAWLFYGPNDLCVALYPAGTSKHTCLGQSDIGAQFEAVVDNSTTRVVGNGYCGQFSSSYLSTRFAA